MGFADGGSISGMVRNWHHGRYRATRSERARQILTELMPRLLKAFAVTPNPDTAFARFDEFIAGLPAGVQLFSLFHANPGLLDMVAEIMGGAPRIADWLRRNPSLLDAVISGDFLEPPGPPGELRRELEIVLRQANDYEDVLVLTRRWTNDQKFRIGVQILRGVIGAAAAGEAHTAVADAVLAALLPRVEAEFSRLHGHVPGGALAVMAFGKLGSRELSPASDLDLVFVYDHPDDANSSEGPKPLSPGVWFSRLCQRLISAITAPTAEGSLYEIDMRLRPSGNKGPTASLLSSLGQYYRESAWTWECMALTRARVVASTDTALAGRVSSLVQEILCAPRDLDKLVVDVADMRERMDREHRTEGRWNIKHLRGGLVDIEFIAQYLLLRYANEHPEVLVSGTADALRRLGKAGVLGKPNADSLVRALGLWWRLQDALRLMVIDGFDETKAPDSLKTALARVVGAPDFAALTRMVDETAAGTYAIFREIIEEPAALARARTVATERSEEE